MDEAGCRLGELVSSWRRDAGLSQASLAEALGIQQAAISKLESGSSKLTVLQLLAILDACGLALSDVSRDIETAARACGIPIWERVNE